MLSGAQLQQQVPTAHHMPRGKCKALSFGQLWHCLVCPQHHREAKRAKKPKLPRCRAPQEGAELLPCSCAHLLGEQLSAEPCGRQLRQEDCWLQVAPQGLCQHSCHRGPAWQGSWVQLCWQQKGAGGAQQQHRAHQTHALERCPGCMGQQRSPQALPSGMFDPALVCSPRT